MPCWHLALYDDFAWFYNRYWSEEFHSLAFPILERIWLPRLPRKGRVVKSYASDGTYWADVQPLRNDDSAEAIARLEVKDFPVIVVNDCHGGDLYEEGRARYAKAEAE